MHRRHQLIHRGRKLWVLLMHSPRIAPDTVEFRRHVILNTVILNLLLGAVTLLLLVPVIITDVPRLPVYATLITAIFVVLSLYAIARTGHYTFAAVGTVSFVTLMVCGVTLAIEYEAPLKFLALSSVLGILLFSRMGAVRLLVVNMIAGLTTAQTLPGPVMEFVTDDMLLMLMLSLALLGAVATTDHYIHQIRAQHQALMESQKRELAWVAENERARVMREWVAYMSHDFRTPLAVMSTTLYVMERNHKPELNPQRIQTLNGQVERLTSLVNHVHAAVSLDHEVKPRLVVQDMTPLIHEIVTRLTPLAAQQKVTIQVKLAQSLPRLPLDTDGFRLALECLLENAILYNKVAGLVTVRPVVNTPYLHLTVEDTGIGISPKDLPFIFDRFYRVDKARQIEQGRNGLGLSIAKMVAEAHHGRVEVKSALGTGSAFTLVLPLALPE